VTLEASTRTTIIEVGDITYQTATHMKRKPKFEQYIPNGPTPMFEVITVEKGKNYWHAKISDAIVGDEPEFRYIVPKKGCPFTVQELANRVAGELNEARGTIILQEFTDNVPTFACVFISNSRQVFCVRSTDHERIKPVDVKDIPKKFAAALKMKKAQANKS